MSIQYCIWGCGIRGKNIYKFMKGIGICAFIDSNPALQGTTYKGIPIVSFETYLEQYRECFVIVSPYDHEEIASVLDAHQVAYFSAVKTPPEFYNTVRPEVLQIGEERVNKRKPIYLYGLNLYSVLLYEILTQKDDCMVRIIPEQNAVQPLVAALEKQCTNCLADLKSAQNGAVYITSQSYLSDSGLPQNIIDLYDFMHDIDNYYNPQLEQFKDLHRGKRCFIVATGPSLRIKDLDRLAEQNEICISMNGIFKAYPETRWRPDHYFLIDQRGFVEWKDRLPEIALDSRCFIPDICLENISCDTISDKIFKFHLSTIFDDARFQPKFSKDFSRGLYESFTVTYCCLQFAAYLGCTEIYLYGVDFDLSKAHTHFTKDYSSIEASRNILGRKLMKKTKRGYEVAKQVAEEMGIRIYNASRFSKLDVFERVDFDSLF